MGEHLLCKQGVRGSTPLTSTETFMYCVYILQSETNGRYYIGHTNNIERRLQQHNTGKVRATANMRPWQVVYTEPYDDGMLARKRERWLKAQKSRRLLEEVVKGP